jgi:hypothetical protein
MSDVAFFARRPKRKHRLRYATRAEIAALEIAGNKPLAMPSDCRLYAIVRRVTSTYCARRFIPSSKNAGVDVDEDLADVLFDMASEEA